MTAIAPLLENFAAVADSPASPERLRDLVLRLAVSGRLVPQLAGETPSAVGLQQVAAERGPTLASSVRGGQSILRSPAPEVCPSRPLPKGWSWARIDDTGAYINGLAFKNQDWKSSGTPIIRIQNLTNPAVPFNYAEGPFPEDRVAQNGDILVSWSATLNAFVWNGGVAAINQHIFKVVPDERVVTKPFLFYLLRHSIGVMADSQAAHGLVMQHINRGPFLSYVVGVPPLEEQRRIVSRIEELDRLCDDLAAAQQDARVSAVHFGTSALHALSEAEDEGDLLQAWKRLDQHWQVLTAEARAVPELRQAILELAVAGKLTHALPQDQSVEVILEDAVTTALDPAQLVDAEGHAVTAPHPIPETWRWVCLGSVLRDIIGGWSAPALPRPKEGQEWGVLKVSSCSWGRFKPEENKALAADTPPRTSLEVLPGDFLISRANTSQLVGRSVVVGETPPRLMLSDKTLRLTPAAGCNPRYLNLANLTRAAREHYEREASGTSDSMKNVSQRAIRRAPVPLPPKEEQDRIVDVVDRLDALCQALEDALLDERVAAAELAGAMVNASG